MRHKLMLKPEAMAKERELLDQFLDRRQRYRESLEELLLERHRRTGVQTR